MKKREIGLLLALMLLMSLLPVGAMASGGEEDLPLTELWVDGVDILTATNNTVTCGSGTASYDADSNTLTLDNAKITDAHRDGFGIFATGNLTISLSGESTISGSDIKDGIVVFGSLDITGSETSTVSSLTVTGSRSGIMVGNPNADNDLNISGSNVTVTANGNDSVGITVDGSLNVEGSTVTGNGTSGGISAGSMTVTGGGSVSGTGSAEDSLGISARYSLIVEGGTVTGEGSRYGIQAGEINVSGKEIGNSIVSGSVSGTSAGNNSEGILSTIVTVNSGGSVTGTGTAANSIGVNVYSLEVNGGTLEGSGTDSGVLSRSITVTGGSVIGTGSSTGIWVYDDENAAAMTISGGGSVTATSTTAGRGIYAPGMNISIDDTSTLTASAKFDGSAVICSTISVGENKYTPEEKEKLTVKDGKVTWEEVEREITLYVNGKNIVTAENNTVDCGDGTATYDTETKVLTLTDATITSAHDGNGIYTDYNLTIELEGSSTISGNSITNGIKVAGDLTINGSGSLETTGSSAGISATGSLSIDGASTVTASSTGNGAPVSCSSISVAGESCTRVDGASVFKAEEGVVTWITNVSALYVDGKNMLANTNSPVQCSGGGTASYDPETNTLTLSGATITAPYTTTADDGTSISCGIYAKGDLNVVLNGRSTINGGMNHGVYVTGSLTITGDGSLEATGSETGIFVNNGPMEVTGGSVTGTGTAGTGILAYGITVTGGSISGTGDETSNGITSRGDMTVSGGGSVRGEGNYAVYVGGNITVSDEGSSVTGIGDGQGVYAEILYVTDGSVNGSTTRTSGSAYGIFVNNGMKVEGGTVDGNSHYVGIQSYGNMEVSGGIVTGDGNLYGIFVPHDLIVTGGSVIGTSAKLGIWVASLQVNGGSVEGTANGSDEDTAEMVYGITAQQGMQIQNGSVTGTASSAGTCYGLSTTGGSVYIDNYSTVKAESSHGRATNFSSFTVGGTEYTLSQDATELKVEDGKVTGAEAKASKSLYMDGVDIMDADGYKVQCDKGGTATYDPDTNTLTLSGAKITNGHTIDGVTFGIYSDSSLNIVLVGTSTVESDQFDAGVYVDGDLTITGSDTGTGSLTATGSYRGIYVVDDLTVNSGTVTGNSDSESDSVGINAHGNMIVNGGEVHGTGSDVAGQGIIVSTLTAHGGSVTGSGREGIRVENGITVEDGNVSGTGNGDFGSGINVKDGNMEVRGGTVTGNGSGKYSCGIQVSYGDVTVESGGTVNAIVNGVASSGISIYDSRLTINGGTVTARATGNNGYGIFTNYTDCITITGESNVTISSETPGCTVSGSIYVGDKEYTPKYDTTELTVVNGVVTEFSRKPVTELYVEGVDIMDADGYKVQFSEGGTASYDPDTKTLTLSGAKITNGHTIENVTFGIYSDGDLNIVLEGTTTVGSNQFDAGVYIDGSLTVTGSGSLEATGSRGGIYVADDLTISSGSVTGNGNGEDSLGISVISNMEVSGGTVTGNGNGEDSCGIYVDDGNMTVNSGGSVTGNGNGEGSCGIRIEELIVNGGRVTGNGTGDYSYGVFANSDAITINGESHYFSASSETPGYAVNGLIYVGGKEYTPKYGATQITVENGTVTQFSPIPEPKPDGALYVNGENILTAENNTVQCGSGKAVYDPDTNTLTLTNATITTADSDGCGIYYESDLNIVLEGTSTVGNHEFNAGIYIEGELTISGTGSLTATGSYEGICVDNLTVNSGTVTGTGDLGIYVAEHMAVNDGTVSGTSTGTGAQISLGIYVYTLTMTGGTVTGEGDTAAIIAILWDEAEYDELISLPEGYLPDGYELKQVIDGSNVYETIVQAGEDFYVDEESGAFVGAVKEITLKAGQSEDTEQPTTPTTPATPTTPSKDPSQQAVDKIENAQGGDTVSVDLTTGKTELDKEVFEELSGKDMTLEVKLPGGVTWTVNGKDIPADADLTDLDMSVVMDTKTIPAEIVNSVTSEAGTVQLTVKNDGEFGFTMTLTAPVGAKNAGMWANLYHYDEAAGKLVYTASALVDRNGYASLPVGSSGQYALVLDSKSHALPFTDLAAGAWYEDAVAYVYRHDLMSGYSEDLFGPNNDLSRAQLCQIIYNMEGRPTVAGGSSFSDVADGAWYTDAVTWAASQGIVDGYGGGLFGPDDNITREQLASILYRYAQAKGYDVSIGEDTNILSYSDASDVAEYAISAMQWACGSGVITGISESALAPRGEATRAQAAMMLMRFCEQYVKW